MNLETMTKTDREFYGFDVGPDAMFGKTAVGGILDSGKPAFDTIVVVDDASLYLEAVSSCYRVVMGLDLPTADEAKRVALAMPRAVSFATLVALGFVVNDVEHEGWLLTPKPASSEIEVVEARDEAEFS